MSHARRKLTLAVSIGLGSAAPVGVLIAAQSAQELQKARHDHYHELGDAKTVRDATRADAPDMAKIKAAAQVINDASINQGRWFAAGTGPEAGKTRALAEIWKRPEDFKAAQKVFSDAAPKLLAAASASDVTAVKSTYGEIGKACKNCHDTFRAPEDHDH